MAVSNLRLSDRIVQNGLMETLESRRMLASVLTGSTLYVTGTESNDLIGISIKRTQLRVNLNNVIEVFNKSLVSRIEIQALGGNDIAGWTGISIPTYINCGLGNDSVLGGLGNDSLTGAGGKDTLRGGAGIDRINGANSNDILYGDDGDDVIYGGFGNDYAEGGTGKDRFFGEDGDDKLVGGIGNDGVYGGEGNDLLYGQVGNDYILGENGNDQLIGGEGDDQLDGGAGLDSVYGELGDDVIKAKDSAADLIDGGDGTDTATVDNSLDSLTSIETIEGGNVGVSAKFPRAISVNDESLWDEHWTDTLAKLKSLDVKAVRLWLNVDSWDERPHAYDNVKESDIVLTWQKGNQNVRTVIGGLAMKRAFELKRAGYAIMITVQRYGGIAPTSADQIKNYFSALLNTTETPTSTKKFKDVVDYWEVGNEVDDPGSWQPSGVNKFSGLQAYVDQYLLPAAEVLHSGTPSTWEKVVSASVRWDPNDVSTILKRLNALKRMDAIDYIGYHPYGMYDPNNPTVNEIKDRTTRVNAIAAVYSKKVIATEWNVRGFPNDGSKNATWAQAIDQIYRTEILPNYEIGFYFNLTNNFATRGGTTSARPAGLLKHNTTMQVSASSSIEDQVKYYQTPFVISEPFYSVFNSWKAIPAS